MAMVSRLLVEMRRQVVNQTPTDLVAETHPRVPLGNPRLEDPKDLAVGLSRLSPVGAPWLRNPTDLPRHRQ